MTAAIGRVCHGPVSNSDVQVSRRASMRVDVDGAEYQCGRDCVGRLCVVATTRA